MKIKLITREEYLKILDIYENFPIFTLQNKGYEGIDKSKFNDLEKEKFKEIEAILSKSIIGFSRFQNFKTNNPKNALTIRFQYDWNAHDRSLGIPFTGVGYMQLIELLEGFNEKEQ